VIKLLMLAQPQPFLLVSGRSHIQFNRNALQKHTNTLVNFATSMWQRIGCEQGRCGTQCCNND
jgi:hypothetical protein